MISIQNVLDKYLILVQNIRKRFAFLSKPFEKHRSLNQIISIENIQKVLTFSTKHSTGIMFVHKTFKNYSISAKNIRKYEHSSGNTWNVLHFGPVHSRNSILFKYRWLKINYSLVPRDFDMGFDLPSLLPVAFFIWSQTRIL